VHHIVDDEDMWPRCGVGPPRADAATVASTSAIAVLVMECVRQLVPEQHTCDTIYIERYGV
jgi:hypothetical protein